MIICSRLYIIICSHYRVLPNNNALSSCGCNVPCTVRRELQEVEALMEELEDAPEDAQDGDLQDDFVIEAMHDAALDDRHAARDQHAHYGAGGPLGAHWDSDQGADSDGWSDSDGSDEAEVDEGPPQGARAVGSIASTYWRPERHDRNDALSMIDERCGVLYMCWQQGVVHGCLLQNVAKGHMMGGSMLCVCCVSIHDI